MSTRIGSTDGLAPQLPPGVTLLHWPLRGGEMRDAVELRVPAATLRGCGLLLHPIQDDRGAGLVGAIAFREARFTFSSRFVEGPLYFMVAVDITSLLALGELPSAMADNVLSTLGLASHLVCWRNERLDAVYHARADERFARRA